MTKLEYGDIYKFMVSLGVVLIGIALLLPWLFLHEPLDTTIRQSDLAALTATAQAVIESRQYTALWFLQNAKYFSIVGSIAGLVLLVVGFWFWSGKQKIIDTRDDLENQKLRLDIKNMTPIQIAEQYVAEAIAETEQDMSTGTPTPNAFRRSMEMYYRIEDAVTRKLVNCFGETNVLLQRRVGASNFDAILLSDRTSQRDVIIEIKASERSFPRSRVNDTIIRLERGIAEYTEITGRAAAGLVLLVTTDGISVRQRQVIEDFVKTTQTQLQVRLVTEEEFSALDCRGIIDLTYLSPYGAMAS